MSIKCKCNGNFGDKGGNSGDDDTAANVDVLGEKEGHIVGAGDNVG